MIGVGFFDSATPPVALRRIYVRLFLLLTVAIALPICWKFWPRNRVTTSAAPYVTTASLVLIPQDRLGLNSMVGINVQSEVDTWLATPEVFDNFLKMQNVREKTVESLAKYPEFASFGMLVNFIPIYSSSARGQLADDVVTGESGKREADYARIEGSEDVVPDVYPFGPRFQRAGRIQIIALGPSPEGSRRVAEAAAASFQKALKELATRKIRRSKTSATQYLNLAHKRVAIAEANVARLTRGRKIDLEDKGEDVEWLRRTSTDLEFQCADLERSIALASTTESLLLAGTELDGVVQERAKEKIQAERVYLPGTTALTLITQKFETARKLARQLQEQAVAKTLATKNAELHSKRKLLSMYQTRLQEALKAQPSAKARQDLVSALKELEGWQTEETTWETKLMQMRLLEQLAAGEGTAILLQQPADGHRPLVKIAAFWKRTKLGTYLPLAPVLAFLLVACLHFWRDARQVSRLAPYYIDAPVLGELPQLDKQTRKRWQRMKSTGSWG
jgi:hypothetical protein